MMAKRKSKKEGAAEAPPKGVATGRRMEAIFQKGATTQVRVWREWYKGKDRISARTHFQEEDGSWNPNQKGVTMEEELAFNVGISILKCCFEKDPGILGFLEAAEALLVQGEAPRLSGER